MQSETKYCCEKHVDIAFDDFLVENETFPCLEKSENYQCSYCNDPAEYVLTKNTLR
jgi:CxxH/CxxC protein (TIGR04129 family)